MADITVLVTSPGTPTTWGYDAFGNYSYGEISGLSLNSGTTQIEISVDQLLSSNLLNTTVNSVALRIDNEVLLSTNLLNSTVNSVFAGENVIVEVTTPGTSTTWGYDGYGENAWGQITGLDTNIDSVSIALGIQQDLTGQQLNSTVNTVTLSGDASLTLSTNLLQISLGNEEVAGEVTITLSTNILNTTIGAYSITADGNTSEIVVGDSMNSTVGVIDASAGSIEEPTGLGLSIAIGDEQLTGDASLTLSTNILNVTTGTASGDVATVILIGSSATTTTGTVSFTIDGSVVLTGVNMTTSTGRLFISAWAVIDIGVTNTWSVVDIAA